MNQEPLSDKKAVAKHNRELKQYELASKGFTGDVYYRKLKVYYPRIVKVIVPLPK